MMPAVFAMVGRSRSGAIGKSAGAAGAVSWLTALLPLFARNSRVLLTQKIATAPTAVVIQNP
jgi:hypothetical protein